MPKSTDTRKQDRAFLRARRGGMSAKDIARRFDTCIKTVHNGIARARLLEKPVGAERHYRPVLVPLYPITLLTPSSPCPHYGPIRKGSVLNCEVCDHSGVDYLPIFRPHTSDPKRDPKPIPKPKPVVTRRQRRAILAMTQPSRN